MYERVYMYGMMWWWECTYMRVGRFVCVCVCVCVHGVVWWGGGRWPDRDKARTPPQTQQETARPNAKAAIPRVANAKSVFFELDVSIPRSPMVPVSMLSVVVVVVVVVSLSAVTTLSAVHTGSKHNTHTHTQGQREAHN